MDDDPAPATVSAGAAAAPRDPRHLRRRVRATARWGVRWMLGGAALAVASSPLAVERAIENASFEDRLGTLPVEVALAHNGWSTLDTGLLGTVAWRRTASLGFGVRLRSIGPPVADGTLASYVSPAFVRANTRFLDDPGAVAGTYGEELGGQVVARTASTMLVVAVIGGGLGCLGIRRVRGLPPRVRVLAVGGTLLGVAVASTGLAAEEFARWEGSAEVAATYPLPDRAAFAFSSPQTREIALQVQPFIEKNSARIRERAAAYEAAATASLERVLRRQADTLAPREGEVVVIAEADPQGSLVGTRVRRELYADLRELLPEGAVVLRTIAGDISSNGTVAEADMVADEATASPGVPVVAAKGDHDTAITVDQLLDNGAEVPDTEIVEVGGLAVASARDPAFKALFGGLVVNDTGLSEEDIGRDLRSVVDDADGPAYVVLHQPRAVAGYLGLDVTGRAPTTGAALTRAVDDGVPDLPPGVLTIGHLHDAAGPWVFWNTDDPAAEPTWTVVTQLGTSGGVEENPTVDRFSTPFSAPLKPISVQLQYLDPDTGLPSGLVPITIATDGTATVGDRIDVGLPPKGATARR